MAGKVKRRKDHKVGVRGMHRVYIWAVIHFLAACGWAVVCPAVLIVWGVRGETGADWRVSVC